MTVHKEDTSDVDAVQIHSAKDLDHEFSEMVKCYQDRETEHNWEVRERSITRIRGILRGNSPESHLDVLVHGVKNMVDGIIKAVESLRTQLAVKALLLVGDIGVYMGKHLDAYIYDQLLMCMMRCAGLTKKMVATASLQATITFIRYSNFYPKFASMLSLAMNDKNTQVRLYTMQYIKAVLQTHAHRDHTRILMDKTNCTDQFESIITKGLNDATPAVREVCREAFWVFWDYWRDRGEYLLKELPLTAQKQLEKSKTSNTKPTRILDSPTNSSGSLRASSSLGRYDPSPSNSTLSNGSVGSADHVPTKSSGSFQSGNKYSPPQHNSPSPPPSSPNRKTRVPGLNKKKSNMGLKRKPPSLLSLLNNEDINLRIEGIQQVAKGLVQYPYTPIPDLERIQLEPSVEGEILKALLLQQFEEPSHTAVYEILSTWECVSCVMLRLLNFEEYVPRLILDAHMDETARRSEMDQVRHKQGKVALAQAKLFLQHENQNLADTLFTSLVQFGGLGSTSQRMPAGKRDIYKLPGNRRKLTKEFLVWMNELLMPKIGLGQEPVCEGVPLHYLQIDCAASGWFESQDHVRQCLDVLLPHVTAYNSGSLWHGPLVTFIKHLRVLDQPLFDSFMAVYDEYTVSKMCRILGIHLPAVDEVQVDTLEPGKGQPSVEQDVIQEPTKSLEISSEIANIEVQPTQDRVEERLKLDGPLVEVAKTTLDPPEILPVGKDQQALTEQPADNVPEIVLVEKSQASAEQPAEQPADKPPVSEALLAEKDQEGPIEQRPIVENSEIEDDFMTGTHDRRGLEVIKEHGEEDVAEYNDDNRVTAEHDRIEENHEKPINKEKHNGFPRAERTHMTEDTFVKVELKGPDLTDVVYDKRLDEEQGRTKSPIPDYFQSNMVPPLSEVHGVENSFYENGDPGIMYSNHGMSDRSTPISANELSTSPKQPPEQTVAQLQISEPNKEKYPEPKHVPFFCPEKVNYPCAVFQSNTRSNAVSVRGGKDKAVMLYALVDKLKARSTNTADNVNTFRKLTRLLKEVPIRRRWDQGGSEENGNETWAGGNGDGGNFVEVVQGIVVHLSQAHSKCTVSALECTRQLAMTQSGLFKVFERKSNDKGMTVESQLTERLLELKSNENPTICIAAEDALDAVLSALTPPTAFEMLMAFIVYRSVITPYEDSTITGSRYHPVGSALGYVARSVRELHDVFYIEEWLAKGAVNAFFKGMNSPLVNVRKSCVEAIVAFHEVIHDNLYLYLTDLREDQSNLIRHYAKKSLKKKASLRNMRETHQFL